MSVLIGSFYLNNGIVYSCVSIAAAILASGRSVRFGSDKLRVVIAGRILLCHAVSNLTDSGVDEILVILPPNSEKSVYECDVPFITVENMDYEEGMASSIRTAVKYSKDHFDHILITNGDMPLFSSGMYRDMVRLSSEHTEKIIAAMHNGVLRNPVIFPKSYYPKLLELHGDEGGRKLLAHSGHHILPFIVDDPSAFLDIDTREDLHKVANILSQRNGT